MKNMFKRIMVLVVIATLFVMPSSTVLAEVIPECIYYSPEIAAYKYTTSPYVLHGGYSIMLHNYNNASQKWDVKAGEKVNFAVFTKYLGPASGMVLIMDSYGSTVASREFTTTQNFPDCQIQLPPFPTDRQYTVVIIAYTDIFIDNYMYVHYTP